MSFFIIVGMIVLFIMGIGMVLGSVFLILMSSAFSGKHDIGVVIPCLIGFCTGVYALYYLFTHLSINIGIG